MMKKEFKNHIDRTILKEITLLIKQGYKLEMVLNESGEYPGILIDPNKKICIAGVKKISLVFSNKIIYKIFPIECNIPSEGIDFIYEYIADIFNIKILPCYEAKAIDFHKLRKTNLLYINERLRIDEVKIMPIEDNYSYSINSEPIELVIDVDLGLVLYASNGYVLNFYMEDYSLLNMNIYFSSSSFDDELQYISSNQYNNKVTIKNFN